MTNDTCFLCHKPLNGRFKLTSVYFDVGRCHKPGEAIVKVQVHTKCLPSEVKEQIPDVLTKAKRFYGEWWKRHSCDDLY